jgi:hypothetical protein
MTVSKKTVQKTVNAREVELVKDVKSLFKSFVDPSTAAPLFITPEDATGCGQMANEIKFNMPKNPDGLISMVMTQNAKYPIALVDRNQVYSSFTLRSKRFFSPEGIDAQTVDGAICAQPIKTSTYSHVNYQMEWTCDEHPIRTKDYFSSAAYGGTPCWSTPLGITCDGTTTISVQMLMNYDVSAGTKIFEMIVYDDAGSIIDTVNSGTAVSHPGVFSSTPVSGTPGGNTVGHIQIRNAPTSPSDLIDLNTLTIIVTVNNAVGRTVQGPTFYNLIENPSFSSLASKGKNYVIRAKSGKLSFRGNDNYGGSVAYRQLDSPFAEVPFGGIFNYDYVASLQDAYDGVLETGLYGFWQPLDIPRDLSYHHIFDGKTYSPYMCFAGNQDTITETIRCEAHLLIQYTTLSQSEKPIIPAIKPEVYALTISLLAYFNGGSENPSHMTRINKALGHINKFAGTVESGLHTAADILKVVGPILASLAVIAV